MPVAHGRRCVIAVDWRMGLVDSGRAVMDGLSAFQAGQKAAMEQNAIRTRNAARQKASDQLATGDTRGAQQTALASGDFDFAKAVGSYSEDQRKALDDEAETLGRFAVGIQDVPVEQREQAFRAMIPNLRGKMTPEQIRNAYSQLQESGWSDQLLNGFKNQAMSVKEALAAHTKANEQYTLAPGSARYDAKGNLIVAQPFAPQLRSVGAGDTLVEIQPGGGGQASTGAGGPLSVDSVLPHIVAQESGGNYAARNASTGALGAYQVMPATGQTLAGRLGLPWRPELMTSATPEGRAYQDQIGRAAVQEAVEASGGDPATMAAYYHGGSDRSKWGPKTQQYAQEVTARLAPGGSRVVATGAPKQKDAPAGYRWSGDRLEPIPGGPADPTGAGNKNTTSNRKAEADFRKEFDGLAEVKNFRTIENQGRTILNLSRDQDARLKSGREPSAQNDIAMIFSYMKMLDPTSVVREGEFATAQNAAGVPDRIRNAFNKAQNGQLMNPRQRKEMVNSARQAFLAARQTYNERAQQFRGYAQDNGVNPDRVATLHQDRPRQTKATPAPTQGWGKATVVR